MNVLFKEAYPSWLSPPYYRAQKFFKGSFWNPIAWALIVENQKLMVCLYKHEPSVSQMDENLLY